MGILQRILNRVEKIRWGRASAAYYRSCAAKSEELARRYSEHTISTELEAFGAGSAAYYLDKNQLGASPVVYSFGVGCDISFDLDVIERTNATVHAFDPTDEAATYLTTQTIPDSFHFMQVGVADEDGVAEIQDIKPGSQTYRPATLLDIGKTANGVTRISTRTLKSITQELGHPQIDVMKLDIEGGEYDVIATLSPDFKPAKQIAMEYHPYLVNLRDGKSMDHDHGWQVTTDSIESLIELGYRIMHISDRGTEISFCLQD